MEKKLSEILFKQPYELNKEERKTQFIYSSVILIIFFYLFSYVFMTFLMHVNYLPYYLAFITLIFPNFVYIFYWDELNNKYGIKPVKSPYQISYQGYVILFTLSSPCFFFLMLALGFTSGNIWFGLGGAVAVVYPILIMFLRIETFNDDSITISKGIVKLPENLVLPNGEAITSENVINETINGFGYMPLSYWLVSVSLGLFTVGAGFSEIKLYVTNGTPSLQVAFLMIIIGLLIQTVYLLPDKINKIVPIDLRTKNGFIFMFVFAFLLFGISQYLFGILI